ncbi:MAG: NAD(P)/FAD-dependent oxidoreductase, partial [Planctomycetes bacterium]|nr:NAD(P)/FAD-dependent oxidoreductase [Planctomycetota bacterium]
MEKQEFDVAIIGSGVGGLCAGALLSHWGDKTLIVESESRLGGRCSTEEIDGFRLSTGAVALHRGGIFEEVYREVGAELDLVDMPHQFYRIGSIKGENYEMPAKGAIPALLDIVNSLEANRAKMLGHMAKEVAVGKVMNLFNRGVRGEEKTEDITFRDWLLKYTENDLVHKTFDSMACNVTSYHTYEVKASEMFALFAKMGTYAALGVSSRGNEENMKSLAAVIRNNGGEVWTECPAQRIIVENGLAKGIVVQKDGTGVEIASRAVI